MGAYSTANDRIAAPDVDGADAPGVMLKRVSFLERMIATLLLATNDVLLRGEREPIHARSSHR
jgi:hypothetical protein